MLEKLFNFYLNLNRNSKVFFVFSIDSAIIMGCLLLVFQMNEQIDIFKLNFKELITIKFLIILLSCLFLHIFYFYFFKIYLEFVRFVSNATYLNIIKANLLLLITINLLAKFNFNILFFDNLNLNFLYFLLVTSLQIVFRSLSKDIYANYKNKINKIPESALIIESAKIEENIDPIKKYNIKIIFCPEIKFTGYLVSGIKILNLTNLYLLEKNLRNKFEVLIIHDQEIINKNKYTINEFRNIFNKVRLLNSNEDQINYYDITKKEENDEIKNQDITFKNKTVLITGGAGSIGTELSKLITNQNIKKIFILDNSEFNLYKAKKEIVLKSNSKVEFLLLDICDKKALNYLFDNNEIDIIYHVAAYKHLNIIENQIYSAVKNNIIGTENLLDLALRKKIDKFIFVSTDKAVKPINVLGFTKRYSELLTLYYNKQSIEKNNKTTFNCVRFGNVFGSSGSVIPHFENQIKNQKNLKIRHIDVTRYYMSINEAVSLVILATNLKINGEIIVFDMGKPIKIIEIAKNLIEFHKKSNSRFVPEIEITNLAPGEKLHEDLFYDSTQKTEFNKIEIETQKISDFKFLVSQTSKLYHSLENSPGNNKVILNLIKDTTEYYNTV